MQTFQTLAELTVSSAPPPTPMASMSSLSTVSAFTPVSALIGGVLIGLSATFYLLGQGRVAGISGMVGNLLRPDAPSKPVSLAFLLGLGFVGLLVRGIAPESLEAAGAGFGTLALAGLLVGFGTQMGNGCTSGHGVCGISRGSMRSILATLTFMMAGATTVFVVRHGLGR